MKWVDVEKRLEFGHTESKGVFVNIQLLAGADQVEIVLLKNADDLQDPVFIFLLKSVVVNVHDAVKLRGGDPGKQIFLQIVQKKDVFTVGCNGFFQPKAVIQADFVIVKPALGGAYEGIGVLAEGRNFG